MLMTLQNQVHLAFEQQVEQLGADLANLFPTVTQTLCMLTMVHTLALRSAARSIARRRVWYLQNALIIGPEKQAIAILQKHLPKRNVIGVDCRKLIWGLGAIHCFTQQQPKF